MTAPVMYEAAGLARKAMTAAVSAGFPSRAIARADVIAFGTSGSARTILDVAS
jgi:hypothetical protein